MESSEWPSVGIFSGMVDHLGNYDECLSISEYGIEGQYCLAQTKYDYPDDPAYHKQPVEKPNPKASVWEALIMVNFLFRENYQRSFYWAIRFFINDKNIFKQVQRVGVSSNF